NITAKRKISLERGSRYQNRNGTEQFRFGACKVNLIKTLEHAFSKSKTLITNKNITRTVYAAGIGSVVCCRRGRWNHEFDS
ncbi:hypothetical protein OFP26_40280, partial [Escherichia coli]|nr:hypothetical protein [Escherichia coli]